MSRSNDLTADRYDSGIRRSMLDKAPRMGIMWNFEPDVQFLVWDCGMLFDPLIRKTRNETPMNSREDS